MEGLFTWEKYGRRCSPRLAAALDDHRPDGTGAAGLRVQRLVAAALGLFCLGLAIPRPTEAIVVNTVANDGVTLAQITSALQGSGVTISNMTITNNGCANRNSAIGLFGQGTTATGPGPVLGDVSGVVLGTGQLKVASNPLVSPNNVANWTPGYVCGGASSDADMRALEPMTQYGEYVAIEFDVVPSQSILVIPFQFGSDEFPEYVCTAYNDIAGIFVSGPGIAGSYSGGAENYAKTAGGDLTSINWVNTGLVGVYGNFANCGSLANTAYYTDNSNGNNLGGNATVATTNTNLELDGWTNYVYQPISVTPGATYHVKATIADAGDRLYDSSIFFHLIFSTGSLSGFDFGDAPDSYRTLTSNGGPRHAINNNIYLGTTPPDTEVTGQPSANALGDDNADIDDEDGVATLPPLSASATSYSVNIAANNTIGANANLIGWIDFNRNGTFESGEASSTVVVTGTINGTSTLTWNGLSGMSAGTTYARFRLTTDPLITTSTPGGSAINGEVEDYALEIQDHDFSITKTSPNISYLPWDSISYTVVVRNNGPTSGTVNNIGVADSIPTELTGVTWTCTASPGATCVNTSGSGNNLNTSVHLPLNGTATFTISGTLSSLPVAGSLSNTATVTAPAGYPDSSPANDSASVTIPYGGAMAGSGDKPLYLTATALSRNVPGALGDVIIDEGASVSWTLSPSLAKALTVNGASGVIPLTLVLYEQGNGSTRDFTMSLTSSSAGVGTFATLTVTNQLVNPRVTLGYNLNLTSPGDKILPAGSSIILTIANNTTGSSNRQILVDPNGSFVNLPSKTVVNVDSIGFHDADYASGGGSPVSGPAPGTTLYIRATMSDPFGSFDISGAKITIIDPVGGFRVTAIDMTEVFDSGGATKIYEYSYVIPGAGPGGDWTVRVNAAEGSEGTVTHTGVATFTVVAPPQLTIVKSASGPTAVPGEVVTYSVLVRNTGTGVATKVVIDDHLSPYTAFGTDVYSGAPFLFVEGSPPSGLTLGTPAYSDNDGSNYLYSPGAGYDGNVTNWRLPLNGSMDAGGQFTLYYQVQVR